VGSRADLDVVVRRKITSLHQDWNPRSSKAVCQRYNFELSHFLEWLGREFKLLYLKESVYVMLYGSHAPSVIAYLK
jgi:hypothetical protein